MNGTKASKSGQNCTARHLDRALTVGGYVDGGRYKDSTARLYADAWENFSTWCSSAGRTSMPATPETIATYAAHLVDQGYTPGTARSRITAVRARHRIYGHPVPDNVASWHVLRAAEPTRVVTVEKGISRTDLLAAVSTCGSTGAGIRNRALVLLAWDLTVPAPDFIALNIEDIDLPPGVGQPALITVAQRQLSVEHDHDPLLLCPVCALCGWISVMAQQGITTGPLFRPVDRLGVIEGSGVRRAGGPSSSGGRLSKRSLYRVWSRLVAASGIEVSTPRALRIGGARHRVQTTGQLGATLERAGWSPATGTAVSRLMST